MKTETVIFEVKVRIRYDNDKARRAALKAARKVASGDCHSVSSAGSDGWYSAENKGAKRIGK